MRYYIVLGMHGTSVPQDMRRWFAVTTRGGPVRFTNLAHAWWWCKHVSQINKRYGDQYHVAMIEVKSIDGMELPMFDLFHEDNSQRTGWTKRLVPEFTTQEEADLIAEFERESALVAI